MRRTVLAATAASALLLSLVPAGSASAAVDCTPPPIVSVDWLASNPALSDLVIVDLRPFAEYQAGHIPGSYSIPFEVPESTWITIRDDLLLELPDPDVLAAALGHHHLTRTSTVVLVTGFGDPPYPQANPTRVAETLYYVGLRKVSILDGGFPAWVAAGKPTTQVIQTMVPRTFTPAVDTGTFVDIDYVHSKLGVSTIVDARDAAVYSGQVVEEWAPKPGHIPSAVSLPSPSIWKADGTYKSLKELKDLAKGVVGADKNKEIIVYCGVGGYASAWTWVLSTVLGYRNVKMYDGSAQEWVRYYDMEL